MRTGKKILMQAAVIAVLFPAYSDIQTVNAEEYSIELIMEEAEIPINYIDGNRIAYIPIRVNGNPGINYLSFVVEKDERIIENVNAQRYDGFPFGVELQTASNANDRFVGVKAGYGFGDYYYDTDGLFCALAVVLPEDCAVGDFYSFNFCTEDAGSQRKIKFKKDDIEYGPECFSYVNGGIRIVDAVDYGYIPEETELPVTEAPPPETFPLVQEILTDAIIQSQEVQIQKTTEEAVSETEISTLTSSEISALPQTTLDTVLSSSDVQTTNMSLSDTVTTIITDEKIFQESSVISTSNLYLEEGENNSEKIIAAVSGAILLVIAVLAAVFIKNNKK